MRARLWFGVGLVCLALLCGAKPAQACTCTPQAATVLPDGSAPAPRNTHVWLVRTWESNQIVLSTAEGRLVPFTIRKHPILGERTLVEIVPSRLLEPQQGYVLEFDGNRSEFRTGDRIDRTPPEWNGVLATRAYASSPPIPEACVTGAPTSAIELIPARDDASESLIYFLTPQALPEAEANTSVQTSGTNAQKPTHPTMKGTPAEARSFKTLKELTASESPWIAFEEDGSLSSGGENLCRKAFFPSPQHGQSIVWQIHAMDLAGNLSEQHKTRVSNYGPQPTEERRYVPSVQVLDAGFPWRPTALALLGLFGSVVFSAMLHRGRYPGAQRVLQWALAGSTCGALGFALITGGTLGRAEKCQSGDETSCLLAKWFLPAALVARGQVLEQQAINAAIAGDPEARQSLARAANLYESACRLFSAPACTRLAILERRGIISERAADPELAAVHFRKGCKLGDETACAGYAVLAATGDGVSRVADEAMRKALHFCDRGVGEACVAAADLLTLSPNATLDGAIELYERGCRKEAPRGCSVLQERYWSGRGVERDPAKSERYQKRALAARAASCKAGKLEDCNLTEEQLCALGDPESCAKAATKVHDRYDHWWERTGPAPKEHVQAMTQFQEALAAGSLTACQSLLFWSASPFHRPPLPSAAVEPKRRECRDMLMRRCEQGYRKACDIAAAVPLPLTKAHATELARLGCRQGSATACLRAAHAGADTERLNFAKRACELGNCEGCVLFAEESEDGIALVDAACRGGCTTACKFLTDNPERRSDPSLEKTQEYRFLSCSLAKNCTLVRQ